MPHGSQSAPVRFRKSPLQIVAHRGASHDAPENTLAAVDLAWQQNADAVEIDVQLTADGRLAVFHDPTLWKVARRRTRVSSLTLPELARVDVGSWKDLRWRDERVPELGQVLDHIPPGRRLLVEIKGDVECATAFEREVRRSRLRRDALTAIGFSLDGMKAIKALLPRLQVLWVVKFGRSAASRRWKPRPAEPVRTVRLAGLDGLDVSARSPWSEAWVEDLKRHGLALYVWTVDRPSLARRLASLGVDGVTTNRPGWLRQQLKGAGSPPCSLATP